MARIKINNKDFDVRDGATLLDAAKEAGFSIPSLCHRNGLPHYTSCMVCLIRDNRTGNYLASCSLYVQDGMDIDVSSEDVISLRRKSVELLLSEHRAECEAPCRVVCPAGYNIPLFNRHMAANDSDSAIQLTLEELATTEIACEKCPGYCENACRRKKIDIPVSIRNMKLFTYNNYIKKSTESKSAEMNMEPRGTEKKQKPARKYNSLIGKLDHDEQAEWLKECNENTTRCREISFDSDAVSESENCMHCDCRAAND
jgi:predicted molibdopterin-dependent oxidoreductase YjgC